MMSTHASLTKLIKAEAQRLGFCACGVAQAHALPAQLIEARQAWTDQGHHAEMSYLTRNTELRNDPRRLVEGTKSIVVVALNYYPTKQLRSDQYQFAWYAYGQDYHEVVKDKLRTLLQSIQTHDSTVMGRGFCDSAPIAERYWAQQAGVGWIGRNGQLILPHHGSTYFLGELLLNKALEYDAPLQTLCGTCDRCIKACPTQALFGLEAQQAQQAFPALDARCCLSYLTIENKEAIPAAQAQRMGSYIYGCDRCQKACPHIAYAQPTNLTALAPTEAFLQMRKEDWRLLTEEKYRMLFKGSAVKRAKFCGLQRNIAAVVQNEKKRIK